MATESDRKRPVIKFGRVEQEKSERPTIHFDRVTEPGERPMIDIGGKVDSSPEGRLRNFAAARAQWEKIVNRRSGK